MASDIYNTGAGQVNNAYNAGKNAIGAFDPNAWASNTQSGLKDLWNQQGTTQNNYIQSYKDAISSNPSVTDLYNAANTAFNVPQLQQNSNNLQNAMLQAPNSNLNAARGFNYDQNQIDQKTSQDLQRLGPSAQAAQNNANTAQTNASNYVQAGVAQNNMNLLPIQEQGQYLMDSYARQQSGFTTAAQSQLQALTEKMNAGVQLSSSEMSAYAQLASAEATYQSSVNSANASIQSAKITNQNQILPTGATYFNPSTGKAYNPFATPARP